jgi:hypothetical protein
MLGERQAYRRAVLLRLDKSHGGEGWLQEALAPILQRSEVQSRNFGSNDPRGKWMVVASSGQDDAEVGGLDPGFDSPNRTRHPCLKVVGAGPGPTW